MKTKLLSIISIMILVLALCSCSTNSMRRGTSMARNSQGSGGNGMNNGMNNSMNNSINSMEGGIETTPESVKRSLGFGANNNYSGNTGTGTGTSVPYGSTSRVNVFPSLSDSSRDNYGQVNTTNGTSDGGMGDMYDDMDMARNSMRVDTFDKRFVK